MIRTTKGKLDYYFIMEVRKSKGDPLGHLLVLPCSVVEFNGRQQYNPSRATNGSDPSEIKVGDTPPGKGP